MIFINYYIYGATTLTNPDQTKKKKRKKTNSFFLVYSLESKFHKNFVRFFFPQY